jgi:hypothetical protein
MVKTDRPVLTQKLNNVRYQTIIVSLANFIEIFIGQPNKCHQGRHHNLLTTQIGDIFDDSIGIN